MTTHQGVTFQSAHGRYLCAEAGGGRALVANRDRVGAWEQFTVHVDDTDGTIALQSASGHYVCVEPTGEVVANRDARGAWETFYPARDRSTHAVGLQTAHGRWLCAEADGRVVADRAHRDAWETWTVSPPWWTASAPGSPAGALRPAQGHVRILDGEVFADADGPFVPVGVHYGEAFSQWCRGQRTAVRAQVRVLRALGYDHARVWDHLGYYQSAWHGREVSFASFVSREGGRVHPTPDYYDELHAFMAMCGEEGLRVLWSSGDLNALSHGQIRDHLIQCRATYTRLPHVMFGRELANEKFQNFPRDVAEDEVFAARLMREVFGDTGWVTYNSCPPPGPNDYGESPAGFARMVHGFFASANVHGTREFGDPEKVLRRHFNYGYERYPDQHRGTRYAQHSTEPGGPGQGVTVGRTDSVATLVGMHAATLIGRSATVYMSSHGVFHNGPIEGQPACAEVARLKALFPPHAFRFTALHGNRPDAWVTSAAGFADRGQGFGRVDQLVSHASGQGIAIAHGGAGSRRLQFTRDAQVTLRRLDDLQITATHAVTRGQVIDPGGAVLVSMSAA